MPVAVGSNLVPKAGQTYYLMEDIFLKGGFQLRADLADRDGINPFNLKVGMLVMTLNDKKTYQLKSYDPDLPEVPPVWEEFNFGGGGGGDIGGGMGTRKTVIHVVPELEVEGEVNFEVDFQCRSMFVFKLTVSRPVRVRAFTTPTRDEPNPYEFIATENHLTDDGTTLLSDGSVIRSRQYSVFINLEEPPQTKMYFTVNNIGDATGEVALSMVIVPMEQLEGAPVTP